MPDCDCNECLECKRARLEAAVHRSPIDALGLILAGEFDGIEEAETAKQIFWSENNG